MIDRRPLPNSRRSAEPARLGIAFTWLWHGLVPKLFFPSADEHAMLSAAGLSPGMLPLLGVAEIALALVILALWRWRPIFICNALVMMVALAAVALQSPTYVVAAFNPVTLNAGMIALSIIGYWSAADLPSASRCLRRALEGNA